MTAKKIQTLIQNFGATRNDFPPKMNVSFGSTAEAYQNRGIGQQPARSSLSASAHKNHRAHQNSKGEPQKCGPKRKYVTLEAGSRRDSYKKCGNDCLLKSIVHSHYALALFRVSNGSNGSTPAWPHSSSPGATCGRKRSHAVYQGY